MPTNYVELDEEEMCYVGGGYDQLRTYTGNDAWYQIAIYAGLSIGSIFTMIGSAAALCAESITIVGAISAVVSFMGGFLSAILNLYNIASAMVYTIKYGSFTAREYGWWIFNFVTVIGK